jgi:hypothetical protein
MVKHGTAKKRRRGNKVTRKGLTHRNVRIASGVPPEIRNAYDKTKSPVENLASFGLDADPNHFKKKSVPGGIEKKNAAFLGFAVVPESDDLKDKNPKRRKMSEVDQKYIKTLIESHGDDYKAMSFDLKLNVQQYTEAKLKNMDKKYNEIPVNDRLA